MANIKPLKERIQDGLVYFEGITPSKWNFATINHAKLLMRLMGEYLDGQEQPKDNFEVGKELFK